MKTDELTKMYYKIKDVAELLDVPQSTLRFWEKEFPQIKPIRSPKNIRYYRPADIETLRVIHYLLKIKGLHLGAAKEQMRVNSRNLTQTIEVIDRLESVKTRLVNLKKALTKRSEMISGSSDTEIDVQ